MSCTPTNLPATTDQTAAAIFAKLLQDHLEFLSQKHYSPATLHVRQIRLDMFVNWCTARGVTEPRSLTRNIVEQYQAYLFHYRKRNQEPLSWSTQHSRLVSLGVWLKWMARRGLIEHNPVAEIELPRAVYKLPEFLSARESEAILHRATTLTAVKLRDRAILETFYSTGMRRSELLKLKIRDFDMLGGVVAIRGGKGNRDRVIPVGDRCLAWLQQYLAKVRPMFAGISGEETVFLTSRGKPFTPNHLSALVKRYVTAARIGKRGACHLFRHTMATLMLEGGADIRYIQQMLGHAKLDTTQIYTHVSIPVLKIVHSQTHPASSINGRRSRGRRSVPFRQFAVTDVNTRTNELPQAL